MRNTSKWKSRSINDEIYIFAFKFLLMKILYISIFTLFFIFHLTAQQADFEWVVKCGNPPNTTDTKTTIATAEDGSFYLAGEFVDTADFGIKSLISAGGTDIFLVKHDNQGNPAWAIRLGSSDYDYVQKVSITPGGDILLIGYFYGTTIIGTDQYTSYGSQDVFLALFNSEGNFLWSRRAGGIMADYITSADVDQGNDMIIAGNFYGEMNFGDTTINAASSSDIYLAKYSPAGDLYWVATAGGSSSDQVKSISCDPDGNIYFTASYYYNFTIADTTLSTPDPVGLVIGALQPDGELLQVFQLQGTYLTPDVFIRADHNGDFYVAGNFSEDIFLGDTVFSAGPFNQDVFVAKYATGGDLLWAQLGTSLSSDQIIGIDIDVYNNLYITGHYLDHIHFGQLTLTYTLCCGSREIFIVNYGSDGKVLWGRQISGARGSVQSMSMNDDGELLLSGMFVDTLSFGDLSLVSLTDYRNYISGMITEMYTGIPFFIKPSVKINLFPNPASDRIFISSVEWTGRFHAMIYSSNGEPVLSGYFESGQMIDVSSLKPGMYIVVTVRDGGIRASSKFLKY